MSERLLPLFRPIYETEGEIADATRAIGDNPDLRNQLALQTQFDDQIVSALQTIALNDRQIEALENMLAGAPPAESVEAESAPEPVTPTTELALPIPTPVPVGPPVTPEPLPVPTALAPTVIPEVPTPLEPPPSEPKKDAAPEAATPPPAVEAAAEKEAEAEKEEEPPRARTITILTAVSVGLIATIALIAYMVWDQMNSFSGADQVVELLNSANALSGDEFEAVNTNTANLKDWFFLKSDMRWFAVPKEFADTPTLGCRVFKFRGADIGQILAKDDREVLMFLFHPADLGVKIRKGKWVIVDGENWVGDVTAVDDCCFIVAFKGKHSDMQLYQAKKLKK
jgi:hypothetical protein